MESNDERADFENNETLSIICHEGILEKKNTTLNTWNLVWTDLKDQCLKFYQLIDGNPGNELSTYLLSMYSTVSPLNDWMFAVDSSFAYHFSIKNCVSEGLAVEEIIVSTDSIDSCNTWIDKLNKIIMNDLFSYLVNLYTLDDIVDEFEILIEFQIELLFITDTANLLIPALQSDGQLLVNSIKDLDDISPKLSCICTFKPSPVEYYSIIVFNADFLFEDNGCGNFVQWFLVNAKVQPDQRLGEGDAVFDYLPPCPVFESGYNRIVTLVFQQPEYVDSEVIALVRSKVLRNAHFDIAEWHNLLRMGPLASITCFAAQWDPHADIIHDRRMRLDPSVDTTTTTCDSSNDSVLFTPPVERPSFKPNGTALLFHASPSNNNIIADFDNEISRKNDDIQSLQAALGNLKAAMMLDKRNFAEALREEGVKTEKLAGQLERERVKNETWLRLFEEKSRECEKLGSEVKNLRELLVGKEKSIC